MSTNKRGAARPFFVSKTSMIERCLLVVLAAVVWANAYRIAPVTVQALPVTPVASATAKTEVRTVPAPTTTPETVPADVVAAVNATPAPAPIPACTSVSPYSTPSQLSLGADSPVLTKVIENPAEYRIYGNTLNELRASISNCAVRMQSAGAYHAITARNISWIYAITPLSDGTCKLSNLHVGLHMAQIFPTYTPTDTTNPVARITWERYIQNLRTHENGHVNLAVQYTESMVNQLQALPVMDCSQLRASVANTINSTLAQLNATDTSYDATTNHGTTQGAVL